ncbi:MAG: hypothetical protein DMF00_12375 [Verrucomicrobia bacterium]|nr:MAG: hypothetical protein DMF00_12375 [Verrucomicrobiota bacterium]
MNRERSVIKGRLFRVSLLAMLLALLTVVLAPFTVSHCVRLWVWWAARQEGLTVSIDKIDQCRFEFQAYPSAHGRPHYSRSFDSGIACAAAPHKSKLAGA